MPAPRRRKRRIGWFLILLVMGAFAYVTFAAVARFFLGDLGFLLSHNCRRRPRSPSISPRTSPPEAIEGACNLVSSSSGTGPRPEIADALRSGGARLVHLGRVRGDSAGRRTYRSGRIRARRLFESRPLGGGLRPSGGRAGRGRPLVLVAMECLRSIRPVRTDSPRFPE